MAAPGSVPAPAAPPGPTPMEEVVQSDINNLLTAFRDYSFALDGNPWGTNAEITKALSGGNAKGIRFPFPEGSTVNNNGELCDRWGAPYFFHQVSGKKMEVRSAGPDREMWTNDDIQR